LQIYFTVKVEFIVLVSVRGSHKTFCRAVLADE
jgi:hypothetical protein